MDNDEYECEDDVDVNSSNDELVDAIHEENCTVTTSDEQTGINDEMGDNDNDKTEYVIENITISTVDEDQIEDSEDRLRHERLVEMRQILTEHERDAVEHAMQAKENFFSVLAARICVCLSKHK